MDYREAGVDTGEGYRAVEKYRELAEGTVNRAVIGGIGTFAGMFSLADFAGMEEPVLVSGADGVGTKLDIAFRMKKYGAVGIDCVAMCVNDVLCHGARPLFFLDYLACGKLDADVAAEIVRGVARGCRETGSVLLGGETAEMPGFYDPGKYDIAGFSVGIVDRKNIIDGSGIRAGDALVGVASSGPHSNGYSLIRRVLPDLDEDFGGMPLGLALLEPTRLYARAVLALREKLPIKGMAHITGGGFYENIPRMFPSGEKAGGEVSPPAPAAGAASASSPKVSAPPLHAAEQGLAALIDRSAWAVPPIFARIAAGAAETGLSGAAAQKKGAELLEKDAELRRQFFSAFNMGIGLVLALAPEHVQAAIEHLDGAGFPAWRIGRVVPGRGEVRFA